MNSKPITKPDHIAQEDWDAVDSPPLTERMLRNLKPAREFLSPGDFQRLTRSRGPQKTPTKEAVSLRLDRDVLDHFRATGSGWQTKINEVLRESAKAEAGTSSKSPPKKMPKTVPTLASAGLKNPATLSPKDIKSISASALTQSSGLSPAARRDKKRSK